MKRFLKILIYIQIISIIKSDWVKISQDVVPSNTHHKDISSVFDTNNYHHLSSILDRGHKTEKPPSQEWLNYQKIRFSVSADNTQKLIVTDADTLKNSAKVINPNTIKNKTKSSEDVNYENIPISVHVQEENLNYPVLKKLDDVHTQDIVQLNKSLISEKVSDVIDDQKLVPTKGKNKEINKKNYEKKIKNENSKYQTPSFTGFLEFLKSMQSKLISNTANGIKDKINKLAELRNKLLFNIEDRIVALWPLEKQKKRSKRGILDDSQNNFPTAETALMTINFLTFAVFLIKLVLQVIKTIKSKHYNFNGFAFNTMEAMSNAGKNARHFGDSQDDIEKTKTILSSIDNFKN